MIHMYDSQVESFSYLLVRICGFVCLIWIKRLTNMKWIKALNKNNEYLKGSFTRFKRSKGVQTPVGK